MSIVISRQSSLDGPNVWSQSAVSQFHIAFGSEPGCLAPLALDQKARLSSMLDEALPSQTAHTELLSIATGESELPTLTGGLAILFQRHYGLDVTFSTCRPSLSHGQWEVVVEQTDGRIVVAAVRLAVGLLDHVVTAGPGTFDLGDKINGRFKNVVNAHGGSPVHLALKAAAANRGIPVATTPQGTTLDLGNGAYRQLLQGTATPRTSSVAVNICKSKQMTKQYLMNAGIPVPDGRVAHTEDQAVQVAAGLNGPVVIKPDDSAAGAGVFLDLRTEADVRAGAIGALAMSPSGTVVVERYIPAREYRFLIINKRVEAVIERQPARVTGDGHLSIEELVLLENTARSNTDKRRRARKPIVINDDTRHILERDGLSLQSVPACGQQVRLQHDDSRYVGGDFVDSLELMHPDNADLARHVAAVVGLDVAGIDIMLADISQSIWESSGAVLEVNDRPGLGIFLHPTIGQSRDPAPAIIDMLFPPGTPARVPIVAITRSEISTALARRVANRLVEAGRSAGLAAADGLYVNATRLRFSDQAEPWAARKILNHPAVEVAVIEVDPYEILERGLAFDYCDMAIVTAESDGAPDGFPPPESVLCRLVGPEGVVLLSNTLAHLPAIQDTFAGAVHVFDAHAQDFTEGDLDDTLVNAIVSRIATAS